MNLFDLNSVYINEPVTAKAEEKNVNEFEKLISQEWISIERFVRFKICVKEDADDILQNVYIIAMQKFDQLKKKESFKAWIISIARNKCNDYFREKAKILELPVEELMGWHLIPKLNEKISWGIYDLPSRKCDYLYDMKVIGKARVHGIEGVEITAEEYQFSKPEEKSVRGFVAQLTDTHCRYLATSYMADGVKHYVTFLDGEEFVENWGYGEDNCGHETHLSPKGLIKKEAEKVTCQNQNPVMDIVGRYNITICGKKYDTVCLLDLGSYNQKVLSEHYLDKNGNTVIWRRFNSNDWHLDRYKKLWTDQLPDNERLSVNGEIYVHWYDCITDFILR